MKNKPLSLCFSMFRFSWLMFFPYCNWLRNDGYDFCIVWTGHEEEYWYKYLLKEVLSLSLKLERLVLKKPHLSTQKGWDAHHLMTNYYAVSESFSLESSYAMAENTMLIEDSSCPWLVLTTSVHLGPLGHGFMRLHQVTHLCLPVTLSQERNSLCLILLLQKGIYPSPHPLSTSLVFTTGQELSF